MLNKNIKKGSFVAVKKGKLDDEWGAYVEKEWWEFGKLLSDPILESDHISFEIIYRGDTKTKKEVANDLVKGLDKMRKTGKEKECLDSLAKSPKSVLNPPQDIIDNLFNKMLEEALVDGK